VVTGFLNGDQAHGRPVGLAIDGTGALQIANDAGNTVWRVAAADGSVTPEPIPTDRVAAPEDTPPTDTAAPPAENDDAAAPPAMDNAPEPAQTEIAPAVGPEDGASPADEDEPGQ